MEILHFGGSNIGLEGVRQLAEAFTKTKSIRVLQLGTTQDCTQ